MGIIEFFVLCVVVVIAAALAVWAMGYFAPGHPPLVDRLVWGVAIVIVAFALLQATGLLNHDPQIPRIR